MTWSEFKAQVEACGVQDTDWVTGLSIRYGTPTTPERVMVDRWSDTTWPHPGDSTWTVNITLEQPCDTPWIEVPKP